VELGVPEFIDREMDGPFAMPQLVYAGPFASALSDSGTKSPLTPRAVYRGGIAAVDAHCRKVGQQVFFRTSATEQTQCSPAWKKGRSISRMFQASPSLGFYCRTPRKDIWPIQSMAATRTWELEDDRFSRRAR